MNGIARCIDQLWAMIDFQQAAIEKLSKENEALNKIIDSTASGGAESRVAPGAAQPANGAEARA